MTEAHNSWTAGWTKREIEPPTHYPMTGYLARKGLALGTGDPLFVRALVLQRGHWRACIVVADLLLVSNRTATRLRRRIARSLETSPANVFLCATHTHSGPLVDSGPFHFSRSRPGAKAGKLMAKLDRVFLEAAVAAQKNLEPVQWSFSRIQLAKLATDRNQPLRERKQHFPLIRLETIQGSAIFGVLPCHPTILGSANRYYSGDLHGEVARRLERRHSIALIANGACANLSTRFTRHDQTPRQVSRFAASITHRVKAANFRSCKPDAGIVVTREVALRLKGRQTGDTAQEEELTGRKADVAAEGHAVARQLRAAPIFRRRSLPVALTILRLGSISIAGLPFELYAETGELLWNRARCIALCYANGYWGYVYPKSASSSDYEVISSPFQTSADQAIREAILDSD